MQIDNDFQKIMAKDKWFNCLLRERNLKSTKLQKFVNKLLDDLIQTHDALIYSTYIDDFFNYHRIIEDSYERIELYERIKTSV